MATHSSTLAWRIPWTEKPGGLQSISSVQFSHSIVSDSLRPHESQHTRPSCPSPSPGVHSNEYTTVILFLVKWIFPPTLICLSNGTLMGNLV